MCTVVHTLQRHARERKGRGVEANELLKQVQQELDQAAEGARVAIPAGHLEGSLVVAKALRLIGQGAQKTILDGKGSLPALVVEADAGVVELEGLCLRRGASPEGGGLLIFNGAQVVMRDCLLEDNAATQGVGGGVSIDEGRLEAHGCHFKGNSAERGGAFYCGGISQARFVDCAFENNQAALGGAWALVDGVQIEAERCRFAENKASNQGAHLHLQGTSSATPSLLLKDCDFAPTSDGNDFFNADAHVQLENTPLPAHFQRLLQK